jgi:hypothetical protein
VALIEPPPVVQAYDSSRHVFPVEAPSLDDFSSSRIFSKIPLRGNTKVRKFPNFRTFRPVPWKNHSVRDQKPNAHGQSDFDPGHFQNVPDHFPNDPDPNGKDSDISGMILIQTHLSRIKIKPSTDIWERSGIKSEMIPIISEMIRDKTILISAY